MKSSWIACAGALLCSVATPAAAQMNACGDLRNAYGPFDYWTQREALVVVETHHFTSDVETLRHGRSGTLGGDIDYTLRASPNHPRALVAMMKLAERDKVKRPRDASYSIDCYLERAIRFRPKDGMARLIFAGYLSKEGKAAEAVEQLKMAEASGLDSGNFHYNLGLAYFDLKDYEKSLLSAHRAYQLGFDLPGLRSKLKKAGKWRDPPAVAAVASDAVDAKSGVSSPAVAEKPADAGASTSK